jgi:hypothetical protein
MKLYSLSKKEGGNISYLRKGLGTPLLLSKFHGTQKKQGSGTPLLLSPYHGAEKKQEEDIQNTLKSIKLRGKGVSKKKNNIRI